MPNRTKRSRAGFENNLKKEEKRLKLDQNNNEEYDPLYDMAGLNDSLTLIENEYEKSCQTEIEFKDASTQTEYSQSAYITPITTHFNFSHVSDLTSILVDSLKEFNGKHRRILSVIIYLLLRLVNVPFQAEDAFWIF